MGEERVHDCSKRNRDDWTVRPVARTSFELQNQVRKNAIKLVFASRTPVVSACVDVGEVASHRNRSEGKLST